MSNKNEDIRKNTLRMMGKPWKNQELRKRCACDNLFI